MKNRISTRIVSLYVFICFIAVVVISKILIIQRIDQEITSVNLPELFKIKASRGNIFSDDGFDSTTKEANGPKAPRKAD